MRVIVTGGSGLTGVPLCERLAAKGHEVYNFDLSLGLNVMSETDLAESFVSQPPDAVIHLAGDEIDNGTADAYRLNIYGTLNVLEACRVYKVPTVLVETSSRVYGEQGATTSGVKTEETAPLMATDPYSVSRICADYLTRSYADNHGLNAVAVRSISVYGTRNFYSSHIIPSTIRSILEDNEPVMYTDGKARKPYLFDEDYADAYITILENAVDLKGMAVNVSYGRPIPLHAVVQMICELMDVPFSYNLMGGPSLPSENLDATLLHSLGWRANYSLKKGLAKTILAFQKQFKEAGFATA